MLIEKKLILKKLRKELEMCLNKDLGAGLSCAIYIVQRCRNEDKPSKKPRRIKS